MIFPRLRFATTLGKLVSPQVLATDDDGDELTYSFESITPSTGIGKFLIDSKTGGSNCYWQPKHQAAPAVGGK